ncbi:MAG: heparan-alpha-glucosaminide N-acetyltransferase [Candidatus Methanoperedens sp.]|nr:heparan-alpha-glucosaminide N-acetyltransferase [Candidatus Methanoperedens sp.]
MQEIISVSGYEAVIFIEDKLMLKNPLPDRIQAIDFIKGIDIILMVLFNYSITLDYFELIKIPSGYLYHSLLPISIASVFIFMSGVTACISYKKHREKSTRRYFMRGMKLLFFAFLITLFTYVFVRPNTIFFGILHFFAVTSFLLPIFIKYHKLNLIAGLSIILSGIYLQQQTFNSPYLLWVGFVPENFSTFDYFPLIPWLGVILLGIYYSDYIVKKTADITFCNGFSKKVTFLGKHSLFVYLIHQPLLIMLLIASGFKLFFS